MRNEQPTTPWSTRRRGRSIKAETWDDRPQRRAGSLDAIEDGVRVGHLVYEIDHRRRAVLVNNIAVETDRRRDGIATELVIRLMAGLPGYAIGASTFTTAEGEALFAALPYPRLPDPRRRGRG